MISPFYYGGWKYHLPLRSGSKVLYFGRPEGIFSLASEGAEVCAVVPDDVSQELLDSLLCSQLTEARDRVRSVTYQKLKDAAAGSFDCAVIHGWNEVSARIRPVVPEYSERRCFDGILRALKPGGTILITDSGVSLIRSLICAQSAGLKPRTLLSFKGALYGPGLYKISASAPAQLTLKSALRSAVQFLLGAGFGAVYNTDGAQPEASFLAGIAEEGAQVTPDAADIYHGSGGVYTLLMPDRIYRMPQFEESDVRCAVNYAALEHLKTLELPFLCPKPSGLYHCHGKRIYAESRVPGRAVDYLNQSPTLRASRARAAQKSLAMLQVRTLHEHPAGSPSIYEGISRSIEVLKPFLAPELNRSLADFSAAFSRAFSAVPMQQTFVHGDFKIANILWSGNAEVSGIIDWDLSSKQNFPLIDYLTYDAFDRSVADESGFAQAIAEARYETFDDSEYRRGFSALRSTPALFSASVTLALLHYGTAHLNFLRPDLKAQWYREHLSGALAKSIGRFLSDSQTAESRQTAKAG